MPARLPPDDAAAKCLDRVAVAAGSRLQQTIVRAHPRDAALGWKAASVHPLQPLETDYQGIVRSAARDVDDLDVRKGLEGEALGDFFFFDDSAPQLLGVAAGEGYQGKPFPLFEDRLADVRTQLGSAAAMLAGRVVPGEVAKLRTLFQLAYDGIIEILRACYKLQGARHWQVPPVAEAERQLNGAPQDIQTTDRRDQFEAILHQLRESAAALETALSGVGTVQMFYVIESFALFRLLVRYRLEADHEISQEAIRSASSTLTDLLTNGHPWLSDWLRDKMVELAARIARTDPSGNTLFFIKGGRAVAYLQGTPANGKNDWDTQVVINPNLPGAAWYDLFLRVSNEVLLALQDFKLQFYMLLNSHAAQFEQELPILPAAAGGDGDLSDPLDIEDRSDPIDADEAPAIPAARRANCKAELIDVGLPRYDTIEAREQWEMLSVPGAILTAADGVPYPGNLYYIDEYIQMLREVFAGDSASPGKATSRIARLYAILQLPGSGAVVADQRSLIPPSTLPLSIACVDQVADAPTQAAHIVLLRQFAKAYRLAADPGLAGFFDGLYAQAFSEFFVQSPTRQVAYPDALSQAIDALIAADAWPAGYTMLANAIGFAEYVSQLMEAHFTARAEFLRQEAQSELLDPVIGQIEALFPAHEERELQLAGGGSFAARLQADFVFFPRPEELDPLTYLRFGLYSPNPEADPAVMLSLLEEPLAQYVALNPGTFTLEEQATPGSPIRLYWAQPHAFENGAYAPLAIEIVAEPPPQRPLLSFVWGNPLLSLRGLIAQYRHWAADTTEYGRRKVLRRTAADLVEMLTSAENPEPLNPALVALRRDGCHHLMIGSDSNAVGESGLYPGSYYPDMAYEVTLTANREALLRQLTIGGPPMPRTLDLLVINRGSGVRGGFAGWDSHDLTQYLVEPLAASGVRANFILLDFGRSASLIETFAPLVGPGGKIVSTLYQIPEAVMTTDLWTAIQPALRQRDTVAIEQALIARLERITRTLTGSVHLEEVRTGASEATIAVHIRDHPDDRDPISIVRYLPRIAELLAADAPGLFEVEAIHAGLLAVKSLPSLGYAEQTILGPVPGLDSAFEAPIRTQILAGFIRRVLDILTSPQYRLELPVARLLLLRSRASLWSLVRDHRGELLGLAAGLPRCPTPFVLWQKSNRRLTVDAQLDRSPLPPDAQRLVSRVDPGAAVDAQIIRLQLLNSGVASVLNPVPQYLQQ
jgi:hypothetical protein